MHRLRLTFKINTKLSLKFVPFSYMQVVTKLCKIVHIAKNVSFCQLPTVIFHGIF